MENMSDRLLACVILAAGKGTRMKSDLPKVVHPLAGRPMLSWILETAESLNPAKIVVVVGPDMPEVEKLAGTHGTVLQDRQRGTADAVRAALPKLDGFRGDVLVLIGDMPCISAETLRALVTARHATADRNKTADIGLSILAADYPDPTGLGRMILSADGTLERIVEEKDATPAEREVTLCNCGAMCMDAERLARWIERIGCDNAQNEFYLTDLPKIAAADGAATRIARAADPLEVQGVNTRADLAVLETHTQSRLRRAAMLSGVTMTAPETVWLHWDTVLAEDVKIGPHVVFGPGVRVEKGAVIEAFSHLEGAQVGPKAKVGPYARLRPGAVLEAGSKVGNFVELKNARLGEGAKANHLTYLGDAEIGAHANIGAGTITCNYDGFDKYRTEIGANVMVGSNTALIAPIRIGDGAYIGAGSTLSHDVPEDALALTRAEITLRDGWADTFRRRKVDTERKK